jgi:kinetochor protein Mis14/NSL1
MATTETTRLTASEFRKVELQSPADLQHLIATARRAARAKIDAAFPPSAAPKDGEVDHVRRRVEQLVDDYIMNTFEGVRRGVSVNGVDLGETMGQGVGKEGVSEGMYFDKWERELGSRGGD